MEYKEKTEYYTIITNEQLETIIPEMVVDFMEYDKSKVHTLRTACFPFPQDVYETYWKKTYLDGVLYSKEVFQNGVIIGMENYLPIKEDNVFAFSTYRLSEIDIDVILQDYPKMSKTEEVNTLGSNLISIQLSNSSHYENKCVKGFIDKAGFDLAVSFYGIENIFTEISGLKFKENIII